MSCAPRSLRPCGVRMSCAPRSLRPCGAAPNSKIPRSPEPLPPCAPPTVQGPQLPPRPVRYPSRMRTSEGPERVRRALKRAPSRIAWRELTTAIDECSEEALATVQKEIEIALAAWPDTVRLVPGRWLRALSERGVCRALTLCRSIDVVLNGLEGVSDPARWTDAPELAHCSIIRVVHEDAPTSAIERFIRRPTQIALAELSLGLSLGGEAIVALRESGLLSHVSRLGLSRNAIGPVGIDALIAPSRGPWRVERLLLGRNRLERRGALALAQPSALSVDGVLDLDCNRLDGEAIRALAAAPILVGVSTLNLSNNPVGREGCAALASSPSLTGLRQLFLHDCGLEDDDVRPLLSPNEESNSGVHQPRRTRNQLQDRLLRPRAERKDDQHAVHLCPNPPRIEGQDDRSCHRD